MRDALAEESQRRFRIVGQIRRAFWMAAGNFFFRHQFKVFIEQDELGVGITHISHQNSPWLHGILLPLRAHHCNCGIQKSGCGSTLAGSSPSETPVITRSVENPAARPPATSCSALSPTHSTRRGLPMR